MYIYIFLRANRTGEYMNNIENLKELPMDDRPYEKCMLYGPQSLSDAELLAVILRSGIKGRNAVSLAQTILSVSGSKEGLLSIMNLSFEELLKIDGIGKVKAIQILCIAQLSRRISKTKAKEKLCFSEVETIADYYMEEMRHSKVEMFKAVFLDVKCNLIKDSLISIGTNNHTIAVPKDVFSIALKCNAHFVIIMHNHPTGDPTPSGDDVAVTERFAKAGKILGIELLDHIIYGDNVFTSFKKDKLL